MEIGAVGAIAQAGGVGIGIFSIWVLFKFITSVMPQMTKELGLMATALTELTEVVRGLKNDIENHH